MKNKKYCDLKDAKSATRNRINNASSLQSFEKQG